MSNEVKGIGTSKEKETELGSFGQNRKGMEFEILLSYEDYLRLLVYLLPATVKSARMMDVIESDIRQTAGNERFRIDYCLDGAEFDITVTGDFGAEYILKRRYCY